MSEERTSHLRAVPGPDAASAPPTAPPEHGVQGLRLLLLLALVGIVVYGAWQARRAKLKKRLRDMADELIKIAAARSLNPGTKLSPDADAFNAFCARFPYNETEDQYRAIDDTLSDLASGRPMDRLVCGDVGFGKTEVALRAAFAVLSGSPALSRTTEKPRRTTFW